MSLNQQNCMWQDLSFSQLFIIRKFVQGHVTSRWLRVVCPPKFIIWNIYSWNVSSLFCLSQTHTHTTHISFKSFSFSNVLPFNISFFFFSNCISSLANFFFFFFCNASTYFPMSPNSDYIMVVFKSLIFLLEIPSDSHSFTLNWPVNLFHILHELIICNCIFPISYVT